MEPREFARGVVDNALRTYPELWFWKGGRATFVWFCYEFGGLGAEDLV